jgi:hypothetical protein
MRERIASADEKSTVSCAIRGVEYTMGPLDAPLGGPRFMSAPPRASHGWGDRHTPPLLASVVQMFYT